MHLAREHSVRPVLQQDFLSLDLPAAMRAGSTATVTAPTTMARMEGLSEGCRIRDNRHDYRPPGKLREEQPWLASTFRRSG